MVKEKFYEQIENLQKKIRETQNDIIHEAAACMYESILNDGCIHLFDTGHIIDSEIINRAGGFELMRRFRYGLNIESVARPRLERTAKEKNTSLEGLAEIALRQAQVLPRDVMVIGSVSGRSVNVIDLALACKKMGVKVIALTSVEYSSRVTSKHSSGKRLFEVADIVIDNCAPYGDAMLDIEGLDAPFIPASGLSAAYIMWALNADLAELFVRDGKTPSILKSVNYDPNIEYNQKLAEIYQKDGY